MGAAANAAPFTSARSEIAVRVGLVDPLRGVYAAITQSEVEGAKLSVEHIGIAGEGASGDRDDMFAAGPPVAGETAAAPVAETALHLLWPT
jgi:branched-chain amino acid transport system substrate-binding protein